MAIVIYTDGAVTKAGSGGWAYVVTEDGKQVLSRSGQMDDTTNNQMELMGPIMALSDITECDEKITIVSDSQYVVQGISNWVYGWMQNGWQNSSGMPVSNKDHWKRLYDLTRLFDVEFEWVKGHAGNQFNEIADKLAQAQSRGSEVEFAYTHTHVKTGKRYKMVRDQNVHWEQTWEHCAVYEDEDGTWVVRNKDEFYDGRFEKKPRKKKAAA